MRAITVVSMFLALLLASAQPSSASADAGDMRQWAGAELGGSFLLKDPPGGAGFRIRVDYGSFFTGEQGRSGFGVGILIGPTVPGSANSFVEAMLDIAARAVYAFAIPVGDHTISLAPSVLVGTGLWFNGFGQGMTASFLIGPELDARFHIANSNWFVTLRPSFPIYIGAARNGDVYVRYDILAGVGMRLGVF